MTWPFKLDKVTGSSQCFQFSSNLTAYIIWLSTYWVHLFLLKWNFLNLIQIWLDSEHNPSDHHQPQPCIAQTIGIHLNTAGCNKVPLRDIPIEACNVTGHNYYPQRAQRAGGIVRDWQIFGHGSDFPTWSEVGTKSRAKVPNFGGNFEPSYLWTGKSFWQNSKA